MKRKEHLTLSGFKTIVAIRASMNWGLSQKLKLAKNPPHRGGGFCQIFTKIFFLLKKIIFAKISLSWCSTCGKTSSRKSENSWSNWIAGFTSGEGCFLIIIFKSKTKQGEAVKLIYQLTQHSRDLNIMKSFITYFNCGRISKRGEAIDFSVSKLSDITDKIIPFFKKYPILGVKAEDFHDWCKVAEMMKQKKHLTAEGLEQIRNIKAGMNHGRKC